MTDPVDELLSEAGRRGRAAPPDPPRSDRHRWTGDSSPARRWLPMVAAAAATMVVAGAGFLVVVRPDGGTSTIDMSAIDRSVADGAAAAEALVVDDGDEAQASGFVLSVPGEPVRFCGPVQNLSGTADGRPGCDHAVEVTGVDVKTLSGATERDGVRYGAARLRGVWRAGVLTVTGQFPIPGRTPVTRDPEPPVPCGPPPGGWRAGEELAGIDSLRDYVRRRQPEQFREPWVTYPYGFTGDVDGTPAPTKGVTVLVVEVVAGDVDAARNELRSRYPGNLCVVGRPGLPSLADQARIQDTAGKDLAELMGDRANGIFLSHQDELILRPQMLVLTRPLYEKLARIGLANVAPDPWLRPVG
jgi:hypothetical protein